MNVDHVANVIMGFRQSGVTRENAKALAQTALAATVDIEDVQEKAYQVSKIIRKELNALEVNQAHKG